jgi:hypothetical protein
VGVSGDLAELDMLIARMGRMGNITKRAAVRAVPALMAEAHKEWSSGESPEGTGWDPLKAGGGTPLGALTSGISGRAEGATIVITTPDELKFHQGGFLRSGSAESQAQREALESLRAAKAAASKERLKLARKRVRDVKKEIRARGTPVAKRPTLPRRGLLPVAWARILDQAVQDEISETLQGLR